MRSNIIVQGAGHVQFHDGFRCALYSDKNGELYCTAELYPIAYMIKTHGDYHSI